MGHNILTIINFMSYYMEHNILTNINFMSYFYMEHTILTIVNFTGTQHELRVKMK